MLLFRIYNEEVRDLLAKNNKQKLDIREHKYISNENCKL